jgi:hypothetical protein
MVERAARGRARERLRVEAARNGNCTVAMIEWGVVLFDGTSAALRAESVLHRCGITTKLIPTPRQLSSDCGLALRFDWHQEDIVRSVLEQAKVPLTSIVLLS